MIVFFFFNDTATTEIYTLSLHDALPILTTGRWPTRTPFKTTGSAIESCRPICAKQKTRTRSEEHTSELQSRQYLVCRLLLEKKKTPLLKSHASLTPSLVTFTHNHITAHL